MQDEKNDDEFDLVPSQPLKRLERRLEHIEKKSGEIDLVKELIEIVRANQEVVDDIVKINSQMVSRVAEVSSAVNMLTNKLSEFVTRMELEEKPHAAKADVNAIESKIGERFSKIEKRLNSLILATMPRMQARPQQQSRTILGPTM